MSKSKFQPVSQSLYKEQNRQLSSSESGSEMSLLRFEFQFGGVLDMKSK